jgi:hypothetical protein
MQLTIAEAASRLAASAETVRTLVDAAAAAQAAWRPAPGQWSILDVVNHLADEEAEDFRTRLDLLVTRPGEAWPPIDPEGWVVSRGYAARDLAESLARFGDERSRSLTWLRTLAVPDWNRAGDHPVAGPITAGSLLASWVVHDLLHVRQLARLHGAWVAARAEPHSTRYAGEW